MTIHLADVGSVRMKAEAAFGSLVGAGLAPPTTVFDSGTVAVPYETTGVLRFDPEVRERNELKRIRGQRTPFVIGPRVGGAKVARRAGTISFDMVVRGPADDDSDSYPLSLILGSALEDSGAPASTSDAVLAFHDPAPGDTDADVNHLRPTDVTKYAEGDVISVDVDGRPCLMLVTEVDDTVDAEFIRVLGAPRHLTNGDTIRFCRTFRPGDMSACPSLALEFCKPGYRLECYGCRLTTLTFNVEPRGEAAVLVLNLTFDVQFARYDHANAAVVSPTYPSGPELQFVGGDVLLTEALPAEGTAGPYLVDRTGVLSVSQCDLTMTVELATAASHRSVVAGRTQPRTAMADLRIRFDEPVAGFDDDYVGEVDRFCAVTIGSPGQGNAVGLVVPVAVTRADGEGREEGDGILVQDLTLGDGVPRGTAGANTLDASFFFAIVA